MFNKWKNMYNELVAHVEELEKTNDDLWRTYSNLTIQWAKSINALNLKYSTMIEALEEENFNLKKELGMCVNCDTNILNEALEALEPIFNKFGTHLVLQTITDFFKYEDSDIHTDQGTLWERGF